MTNPFNEINHLRPGKHFGFFNAMEKRSRGEEVESAAIEIPHPWTGECQWVVTHSSGRGVRSFCGSDDWGGIHDSAVGADELSGDRRYVPGCVYPFGEATKEVIERDDTFLGPISLHSGRTEHFMSAA